MHWKKERDLLIAQTMAFVQSVTGRPMPAGSKTESRLEPAAFDEPAASDFDSHAAATAAFEIASRPADVLPVSRFTSIGNTDLRDEIRQRVSAFRAKQQLFDRDRDEYCKTMMAKARAASEQAVMISDSRLAKR